ncbi:hypothetical protein [Streptomyces sp. NBC_01669]|uniref:hypothetical protein n=1 Tax=Streptomyces sp. NBC_01669 TaxID=2975909 RepID=UPI002256CC66|nr:hypothetical protein [Streptomyces sp. NBC_01669]MCX4537706.1 hypothetical protein [Streptomyces sp. NBC_01669]
MRLSARAALLRREGLYHSHIIDWRTARDAGALADAYATNPHRFRRRPTPPRLPKAAWINQPAKEEHQEEPAA